MPIQVIPAGKNFGSEFGKALGGGLGQGFSSAIQEHFSNKQQSQQMQQENEAAKRMGVDLSGISDPETRKALIIQSLKGQQQENVFNRKQGFLENVLGKRTQEGSNQQSEVQSENQQFNPSMISDAEIAQATAIDPSLGRELRAAKDSALTQKRFEQQFEERQRLNAPEHRREQQIEASQAQADVKYNQTLQEASKQHELKEQSLDRLEKLNRKGVTGKPYEKWLENHGLVALTSDGRREFAADVKNLITDIRSILGAQFTGFEFQTILNAYPSADFSQGANEAIIKNLKAFQDIKKKEVEFSAQLKKDNGGKIPFDFQSKVNEKVRSYAATKTEEIKNNTVKRT